MPVALYAGILFYFSSLSKPPVPEWHLSDRLLHLLAYAVFGFLFVRAFRPADRRWRGWQVIGVAFSGALLYGLSDEFHQSFVPQRSSEILDLVMDGLGGVLGGALFIATKLFRRRDVSGDSQTLAPL